MSNEATTKKPWPADAIMIVAAIAGKELRDRMEGVYECECRDCGRKLHADTRSIRTAELLPSRHMRPVRFFCIDCCINYDRNSITELHDHRRDA